MSCQKQSIPVDWTSFCYLFLVVATIQLIAQIVQFVPGCTLLIHNRNRLHHRVWIHEWHRNSRRGGGYRNVLVGHWRHGRWLNLKWRRSVNVLQKQKPEFYDFNKTLHILVFDLFLRWKSSKRLMKKLMQNKKLELIANSCCMCFLTLPLTEQTCATRGPGLSLRPAMLFCMAPKTISILKNVYPAKKF